MAWRGSPDLPETVDGDIAGMASTYRAGSYTRQSSAMVGARLSLLELHGGPFGMYGDTFMHEFHLLAAQGYAILLHQSSRFCRLWRRFRRHVASRNGCKRLPRYHGDG